MTATAQARDCHSCPETRVEPKHLIYCVASVLGPDGRPQTVDLSTAKHLRCCAADGCDVCTTDLEFVGHLDGPELVAAMQNKSDDHKAALTDRHGVVHPEG